MREVTLHDHFIQICVPLAHWHHRASQYSEIFTRRRIQHNINVFQCEDSKQQQKFYDSLLRCVYERVTFSQQSENSIVLVIIWGYIAIHFWPSKDTCCCQAENGPHADSNSRSPMFKQLIQNWTVTQTSGHAVCALKAHLFSTTSMADITRP